LALPGPGHVTDCTSNTPPQSGTLALSALCTYRAHNLLKPREFPSVRKKETLIICIYLDSF